eukprot:RCo024474
MPAPPKGHTFAMVAMVEAGAPSSLFGAARRGVLAATVWWNPPPPVGAPDSQGCRVRYLEARGGPLLGRCAEAFHLELPGRPHERTTRRDMEPILIPKFGVCAKVVVVGFRDEPFELPQSHAFWELVFSAVLCHTPMV